MKTESVTVSKRGYIVLPTYIRKEMNIKPGTRVLIDKEKGRLTLETVTSFTKKLVGLTQKTIGNTPDRVEEYFDQARKERVDD